MRRFTREAVLLLIAIPVLLWTLLPIYHWHRIALVPKAHPLAEQQRPLDLHALAEYPLVTYVFSLTGESSFKRAFRERGLEPRVVFTARDADIKLMNLRLDHNRAVAQLASKADAAVSDISHMAVWGNHSPTMYPDLFNAKVRGERAWDVVADETWVADEFIPRVGKRGAEIIEARGASSAASAANAAVDHVRDWVTGTGDGWVSMAVPSTGAYGVEEGIISSFPCRTRHGEWEIVEGLDVPDFSRERIDRTVNELKEERDAVKGLGLV